MITIALSQQSWALWRLDDDFQLFRKECNLIARKIIA